MMKLIIRLFAGVALCLAQVGLAGAFSLHNTDGNFTVELPVAPTFEHKNGTTEGGIAYDLFSWTVDKGEIAYIVTVSVYAKPVNMEYDGPTGGLASSCKGKLVNQQSFRLQGMTGREVFVECPGPLMFRERLLWVGSKFYQFLFAGPPGTENSADAEAFLNSVHIGE
ncbi:MAG: hypothetical protein ACLPID_17965 [Beijerinckiaceae bacterium]